MFAKPREDEKALAPWAIEQVREWGGVLEHPQRSKLWADQGLPLPGLRDEFGGWTLPIAQKWWGHKAEKATWLYIVGCDPLDIPNIPLVLGESTHVIASSSMRQKRNHPQFKPEVTKAEREHTPLELAAWLVELARRCKVSEFA